MLGYVLGGAAALGLGWLGYNLYRGGGGEATGLLNFKPFAVKQGQSYTFLVLAPSDLIPFVAKMFPDDVATARISPIVKRKNMSIDGPSGPKNIDLYEHRVIWKAPDAVFTPEGGVAKLQLKPPAGVSAPRALAAALYQAAASEAGTQGRLVFFPVGASLLT